MTKEENLEELVAQWEDDAKSQLKNGRTRRDRSKKWEMRNGNKSRNK